MPIQIILETGSKAPIYKQLVEQFEDAIRSGKLKPGEQIPSMNDFAVQLGISKETVKKTYGILREKGLLVPQQGKGFYVAEAGEASKPRVLVLFDKLSIYKEVLFNSLAEELGDRRTSPSSPTTRILSCLHITWTQVLTNMTSM